MANTRFVGIVDKPTAKLSGGVDTVKLMCRDYTSIFLSTDWRKIANKAFTDKPGDQDRQVGLALRQGETLRGFITRARDKVTPDLANAPVRFLDPRVGDKQVAPRLGSRLVSFVPLATRGAQVDAVEDGRDDTPVDHNPFRPFRDIGELEGAPLEALPILAPPRPIEEKHRGHLPASGHEEEDMAIGRLQPEASYAPRHRAEVATHVERPQIDEHPHASR